MKEKFINRVSAAVIFIVVIFIFSFIYMALHKKSDEARDVVIEFITYPAGGIVSMNGQGIGVAPCMTILKQPIGWTCRDGWYFECEWKDGYSTQKFVYSATNKTKIRVYFVRPVPKDRFSDRKSG